MNHSDPLLAPFFHEQCVALAKARAQYRAARLTDVWGRAALDDSYATINLDCREWPALDDRLEDFS